MGTFELQTKQMQWKIKPVHLNILPSKTGKIHPLKLIWNERDVWTPFRKMNAHTEESVDLAISITLPRRGVPVRSREDPNIDLRPENGYENSPGCSQSLPTNNQ
jgi:hypothetical protein